MSDTEFIKSYHLLSQEARAFVDQLLLKGQLKCESQEKDCDIVQAISYLPKK